MSMKEDRAREGKKAKYRKMGFGPAMDRGEIDFGDKHPLTKKRLKNFKKKDDAPMSDERFYQQRKAQINKTGVSTKKMLTGGQAKIAAKAPPPNKIDAKDFAVLRSEKAKGRGMGLQDEKVQPGKVMKAKIGVATDYKKYLKGLKKATDSVKKDKEDKFLKRRKELMGMPKLSKGGGADSGTEGERRSVVGVYTNKIKRFLKDAPSMSKRDIKAANEILTGGRGKALRSTQEMISRLKKFDPAKKMGGGMMQKPMGYSKGVSVKARGCKLGRTKPTKIT